MLKQVSFTDRRTAEETTAKPSCAIISISEPGWYPARLQNGWFDVLRLEFHDVEVPEEPFLMFDLAHALEVVDFVERMERAGCTEILVHCKMGISRSAAVALCIEIKYGLLQNEFQEQYSEHNRLVFRLLSDVITKLQTSTGERALRARIPQIVKDRGIER